MFIKLQAHFHHPRSVLVRNTKPAELPRIILPIYANIGHLRTGRAFFTPLEQSVYPIPIPFKQGFDNTISSIFYPSKDSEPIGGPFGLHPKKHTLHPAADGGVGSDFIFHGYPPNASLGIGQNVIPRP
jgi:hypothetical protein